MRRYFLLGMLFFSHLLEAQNAIIGKVQYIHRKSYQNNQLRDTISWLYFSDVHSVYNVGRRQSDGQLVNPHSGEGVAITKSDLLYPYCYKDIEAGWVRHFTRVIAGNNAILAEDTLKKTVWHLGTETKQIAEYLCKKASGKFGGREYAVWFTPDIPVATGPYKLWGLPGLILEAYSLDGQVEFLFKSVEISSDFEKELIPPTDQTIIRGGAEKIAEEEKRIEDAKVKEILALYPNSSFTSFQTALPRLPQIELTVD